MVSGLRSVVVVTTVVTKEGSTSNSVANTVAITAVGIEASVTPA